MEVPIYKLKFSKTFQKRFFQGCKRIFDSGILTNGTYVRQFEKEFAKFCNTKYALAVTSGTAALEIVLRALNIRGKNVILPTNTFIATAVAVKNAGGEILPLDIENETLALSPNTLKKALNEEKNIAAVIVVHIGGIISRHIKTIVSLCKEHKVPLIEDAAHAHGSEYKGRKAGTFGIAGCFSFFPTKVMTTGEGGIITTDSQEYYELMCSIRYLGKDLKSDDLYIRSGSNFRMTEFQALLGLLDLERMPRRVQRRSALAAIYQEGLQNSPWKVVVPPEGSVSSYYKQIIRSPLHVDKVHSFCKRQGVALTGEVYRYPLHKQPVYKEKFASKNFPAADKFCSNHICPPLYPELSEEQINYVCKTLLKLKK